MDNVYAAVERLLETEKCPIIAIDGCAAAGKTTLARALAGRYGFGIVQMDDFFLPFDMRTPERLNEPGGNLHRERFIEEVLPNLGKAFSYHAFDCSSGRLEKQRRVPAGGVIVEGAYSMHPEFGDAYDLCIFMDISPSLQRQRIIDRNGDAMWQRFESEWIPMESKYHSAMQIKNRCQIILNADDVCGC